MSKNNVIDDMNKDKAANEVGLFTMNRLGINLCSVDSIKVTRREDGQIEDIHVKFIPSEAPTA